MNNYGPDVNDLMATMFDAVRQGADAVIALSAAQPAYGTPQEILRDAVLYASCCKGSRIDNERFFEGIVSVVRKDLKAILAKAPR